MIQNNQILTIPHDHEAEQAVIGSIIFNNDIFNDIAGILSPNSFYIEAHRNIYRAILKLVDDNQPIDEIILGDQLKALGKLEEIGGYTYLAELVESVPALGNIVYYAKIIQEHALVRDLITTTAEIGRKSRDPKQNVNKLLVEAENKINAIATRFVGNKLVSFREILKETWEESERMSQKNNDFIGFPTGFEDLDKFLSGLIPGNLYVVAGRPSMGKTAFCLNLVINKHKNNNNGDTLIYLREGSNIQAARRMLSAESCIDSHKIKLGKLNQGEWDRLSETIDKLTSFNIYLDDQTEDIDQICYEIKGHSKKRQIDLIATDYLQLMETSSKENREQQIAYMTRKMKNLAKSLNVPIILLSQLNRAVELRSSKIPQLSDLRESGSIEQDADIILFLYRDEIYNKNSEFKGLADVIIAKHRDGPTGAIKLIFKKEFTLFKDIPKYGIPE